MLSYNAVQKKGYVDLQQELPKEDSASLSYGATLQKDLSCTAPCSWAAADPSAFLVRGKNYLNDNIKVLVLIFLEYQSQQFQAQIFQI